MAPTQFLNDVELFPRATYVGELRRALPASTMTPARSRVVLIPMFALLIAGVITVIGRGWVPWPVVPVLSLVLGVLFAGMTFVTHELLHGGIVRNKRVQLVLGWLGFVPFTLSPHLWLAWHNNLHHGNTAMEEDPDTYATLDRYNERAATRFSIDVFSLGGRRWRGALSLILGFTVQSADQLLAARSRAAMSLRHRRLAIVESSLSALVWLGVAILVGPLAFVFVFVVPLLVANVCVMSFILTNHSLSPRVEIDDPLISCLTVTTSRLVQWFTLGFGFHTEHHLFPAMSSRHAPAVRDLLRERWPERYQSMPLRDALSALHRTARVYKTPTTLFDPHTGAEFPTLLPR